MTTAPFLLSSCRNNPKVITMRKKFVIFLLLLKFGVIIGLFWYYDWIYSQPTPIPADYKAVQTGSIVDLAGRVPTDHRPLFLHFFNPDCPCSRFNIPHFRSLVQQYGVKVRFVVVVMTRKSYTIRQIQDKFDLPVTVSFDSSIAVACGVYSTPQAAILTSGRQLYYRGNYNKSRY